MADETEPVVPPVELAPPLVGTGGQPTPGYAPPPAFVPPSYAPRTGPAASPSGQVPPIPAAYAPPTTPAAYAPPAYAPPAPAGTASAYPTGLPPYANQPQTAATGYPLSPPPGHPAAAQYVQPAPPASSGRTAAIVIGSVTAVIAIIALIVVTFVIATSPGPTTISGPDFAAPAVPSVPDVDTNPGATAVTDIRDALEAKIDEYRAARESGALWERIPDNDFNRTAVSAFLYLLTDMKVATAWGIDEDTAAEYAQEMTDLEERLLAEEPLGSDVTITLSDRTFTYDGSTGEGGYTDD